jgi:hypothetical protein
MRREHQWLTRFDAEALALQQVAEKNPSEFRREGNPSLLVALANHSDEQVIKIEVLHASVEEFLHAAAGIQ